MPHGRRPIIDYQDATVEVHRVVVGPVDNNVYIVRCRRDGRRPADRRGQRARPPARAVPRPRRAPGGRDPRPLGPHPGRGGGPRRRHRRGGHRGRRRHAPLVRPAPRRPLHPRGRDGSASAPSPRPGHTPGSMCFAVEGTPLLFTGDTLFPGGPGNTSFEHADFATIIRSIEDRLFAAVRSGHHRPPRPRRRNHHRCRVAPPRGVDRAGLVSSRSRVRPRSTASSALGSARSPGAGPSTCTPPATSLPTSTVTRDAGERDPVHLQVTDPLGQVRTEPGLAVGDPRVETEQRPQAEQGRGRRPTPAASTTSGSRPERSARRGRGR